MKLTYLQAKKDRKNGLTYKQIADKWRVGTTTVYMALNPKASKRYAQHVLLYQKKHPLKVKRQNRKSTKRYRENHPERVLLQTAKARSLKDGIKFSLVETDIHIPKRCPVLGLVLKTQRGKKKDNSPSLDRIKPKKGYVKGNIAVISQRANFLKNNETNPSVFDAIANYMRRTAK